MFLCGYPDRTDGAMLLYDGIETFWLDRQVLVAPWHRVI